jgi:predicted Fe-S protein YdhL (DUF1289 family)
MNPPRADIPSPCVKVCVVDPRRGACAGCYRTLEEIAGWPDYSPEQKRAVWWRIAERRGLWGPPWAPVG